MTLSTGTRLGPYEILSAIGAGGMGEVYRARDSRLGRDVAIKVLPEQFSKDPERLRRFEREARSASAISDAYIVAVYDVGEASGIHYLATELVEGSDLRHLLDRGPLPVRRALELSRQIASGLASAHEKGIVHRDLKPENILLTKSGQAKIADFGLAKLVERSAAQLSQLPTSDGQRTSEGLVLGTVSYMSPEQARGIDVDPRSDIFSFGSILYEMLSGKRPFSGITGADTMSAILKEDPPDLAQTNRGIPPGLERVVRHCLEKDPEERFQSARDLAFALASISEVSGARAATRVPAKSSRFWRKPFVAPLLIGIGILAGWGASALRQKDVDLSYKRITFRRGTVYDARFGPDGQTVVYSAAWEGQPARIFATRAGSIESRNLELPDARILAVSSSRELAISLGRESIWESKGTLARVPLDGGAPRELLENVSLADWTPDGRDLAVVHKVGGRDRVEFPIGKVLYETSEVIESARFSPRGDRLAVSLGDGLILVDLNGKVTTLTKGWNGTGNLAWRPDGSEIWFAGHEGAKKYALYAVTPSGRVRTVRREAGGLYLHDISSDGRVLLNDYFWHSSLAALPGGESTERDLSWMDRPNIDAISSDGRSVVFDEWGEGGGDNGAIYLRATDGSPAVRLGEGAGLGLSPDGRWVLSQPPRQAGALVLLPTGPGQPVSLMHPGVTMIPSGRFLPDGKRILFLGLAGTGSQRVYVQNLEGGERRAISPEGMPTGSMAVSPDGRFVAARGPDGKVAIYPVDAGVPRQLAGAETGDNPILWSADGGALYLYRSREAPAQLFRVDLATGRRDLWKTIAPADRSGLVTIDNIVMTPDARSYAYSYQRILTSLEVVEGLR